MKSLRAARDSIMHNWRLRLADWIPSTSTESVVRGAEPADLGNRPQLSRATEYMEKLPLFGVDVEMEQSFH